MRPVNESGTPAVLFSIVMVRTGRAAGTLASGSCRHAASNKAAVCMTNSAVTIRTKTGRRTPAGMALLFGKSRKLRAATGSPSRPAQNRRSACESGSIALRKTSIHRQQFGRGRRLPLSGNVLSAAIILCRAFPSGTSPQLLAAARRRFRRSVTMFSRSAELPQCFVV